MPRYRPFLILGFAIVIALITSVMLYNWLNQNKSHAAHVQTLKTQGIAVATAELAWGTVLTKQMVEAVAFPADTLPDGAIRDADSLVGRVVLVNMKRNEPILESKLAPTSVTRGGVAAVTNPDKRAMAVKVDEVVGVAGFVKPGDRVDMMVTIQPRHGGDSMTKVVLSNTLVLAVGSEIDQKSANEKPLPVTVITVEVTPEEAEKLALATTEGKLRLALRNPMNPDVVMTKGATVNSLLASYRLYDQVEKPAATPKKVVERRPPEPQRVEVIKGGAVSSVKFGHEMSDLRQ
jgi:pilus assembly protein CpaB